MVIGYLFSVLSPDWFVFFAQQQTTTPKLPEPVKYAAYMALIAIALLGMLLIVGILLGGNWVRKLGKRVRRSSLPPDVITPRRESNSSPKIPNNISDSGDTIGTDETIG